MAVLTPGTAGRSAGFNFTGLTAAAGGGDKFTNDGQTYFVIKNGDASPHTVSFAIQLAVDGVTPTFTPVNLLAGETRLLGPFPSGIYNDANGQVNVTYSAVTSVTVAAVKAPPAG